MSLMHGVTLFASSNKRGSVAESYTLVGGSFHLTQESLEALLRLQQTRLSREVYDVVL